MTSFVPNNTRIDHAKRIISQSRKRFSTLLSRQLDWMSRKEAELSNHKKFRTWISKQVFGEYKLTQRDGSRILSALYGQHRDCDASSLINHIQNQDTIFDVFGKDDLENSLIVTEAFLEAKNMRGFTVPFLVGTALYFQLVLMGARHTPMGFGGNDFITATKVKKATAKAAKAAAEERSRILAEKADLKKAEPEKSAAEADTEDDEIAKAMAAIALISGEWADEEW